MLANHQDFANVIPAKKKLAGSKVLKQIFYMAVIEDPLQLKALDGLEFESIFLDDMVTGIKRFRSCVFGMKEGQQMALGLQHGL
jgi:hypothetical protein